MIKGQISIFVSSEKNTGCGCQSGGGDGGVFNASVLRVKTSQVAPSAGLCQHISLSYYRAAHISPPVQLSDRCRLP